MPPSVIGGKKFESVPKLVAYAGLYPKNRQSGESVNSKGHLSKRGFPYLRRAIWLASFKDPAINKFYELLSIIFAVLRDNKPYVPAQISP